MKEFDIEISDRKGPITGLWTLNKALAMQQVAEGLGVGVQIVAEAGQEYPLKKGGTSIVREGSVYLHIYGEVNQQEGLAPLYRAADELLKRQEEELKK